MKNFSRKSGLIPVPVILIWDSDGKRSTNDTFKSPFFLNHIKNCVTLGHSDERL